MTDVPSLMVISFMKVRLLVHVPATVGATIAVKVGTGVNNCGTDVVVGRTEVGPGSVGGRNGVGVTRGAHASAKKITSNKSRHERSGKRSISLLNHKATEKNLCDFNLMKI